MEAADIAVAKYAVKLLPTVDDVSQRQLYRDFGQAWVDKQIATGRQEFSFRRRGNRKLYNRSAFAAQWTAERCTPDIIGKWGKAEAV